MPAMNATVPHTEDSVASDRDTTITAIRRALRARSGKAWSVTGGRGTARSWITITAPPARRDEYDRMTEADAAELAGLLGLDRVGPAGEDVPPGRDFRREYIDRAQGRTPTVYGVPTWD